MKARSLTLSVLLLLLVATGLHAHFPWLAAGKDGHALLFFGESPAERAYKIPVPVMEAEIYRLQDGKVEPVTFVERVEDDFLGRVSEETLAADSHLFSKIEYGNYHGMFLQYYAVHQGGELPATASDLPNVSPDTMPLFAHAVRGQAGVEIIVLWQGKALADAKVALFDEAGESLGEATSDATGTASFTAGQLASGFNAVNVGHESTDPKETHYLTLTFAAP